MQLGGFSQSFSAQMISLKQIFATMLTRAKTHCEEWWKQNLSHIWFSAEKGFETGLERCWRPQQKCLQELGLWTGTVKAVVIHTELANLQTSVQRRDARLGLQESQGEQRAPHVRNEAHWKYCQENPGWGSMDEQTALAELYSALHGAWLQPAMLNLSTQNRQEQIHHCYSFFTVSRPFISPTKGSRK